MVKRLDLLKELLNSYDYNTIYRLRKILNIGDDTVLLVKFAIDSNNFDFKDANMKIKKIQTKLPEKIEKNINDLIKGDPNAVFNELICSLYFQIVKQEYIDFSGRVYRFCESVFKYIFAVNEFGTVNFYSEQMDKRFLLKILKEKYDIRNNNIIFAVSNFFKNSVKYQSVINNLNNDKMKGLIELRHNSIVGHGFFSVDYEKIVDVYAAPEKVLKDFERILEGIGIVLFTKKYKIINELIVKGEEDEIKRCSQR